MATRTAEGVVSDKTSGTTLTLSNVSLTENHAIFVIVGFKGTASPTLKAGTKDMTRVIQRINSTEDFGAAIFYKRVIRNGNTRDIVATWATAIEAKSMIVLTVSEPVLFFEGAGNMQSSASPTTSANLLDLPVHDCFHLAGLIGEGPTNDVALTVPADWTVGQRGGTAGIPPVSNITVTEAYKTGRCIDAEECDSSGTDVRFYSSILASFAPMITLPPISHNNEEIAVGDTVSHIFAGGTSTVSSFVRTLGNPFVKCVLADGRVFNSIDLEVSE